MLRSQMLEKVSACILEKSLDHPTRVAIDGIDAAGKTKLSRELVFPLKRSRRQVVQISLDNFQNPAEIRYRRGKDSPEGYYYDSYNYTDLIDHVLKPSGPNGNRQIKTATFDVTTNTALETEYEQIQGDAILLFDGLFLTRPELHNFWDMILFVDISLDTALSRAVDRELPKGMSYEAIKAIYEKRYFGGQKIYFERCHPFQKAHIVIDNNDYRNPLIKFRKATA